MIPQKIYLNPTINNSEMILAGVKMLTLTKTLEFGKKWLNNAIATKHEWEKNKTCYHNNNRFWIRLQNEASKK